MTLENENTSTVIDNPYGPSALDTEAEAFISDLSKDFSPEVEESAASVGGVAQAASDSTPKPAPVPEKNEDPAERGLERLVAREVELRERETALLSTQKEMESLRSRLRELEPRAVTQDLLDKIKLSPAEGLRALGLDPDEVVRAALVEKMGDKANSPEVRDMMEKVRIRKEMETLKAQVADAERRQAAQAYYAKIANGAREHVTNIDGISKYAPTVASVAKVNPDRVFQEIMEEISRDAAYRAQREPDGDVITYEEAATRVEKRWLAMKTLLEAGATAKDPAPTVGMLAAKTTVQAQTTPKSPPTTIKPPERPLAPWLQRDTNEDEAIREAILEWNRAESASKR